MGRPAREGLKRLNPAAAALATPAKKLPCLDGGLLVATGWGATVGCSSGTGNDPHTSPSQTCSAIAVGVLPWSSSAPGTRPESQQRFVRCHNSFSCYILKDVQKIVHKHGQAHPQKLKHLRFQSRERRCQASSVSAACLALRRLQPRELSIFCTCAVILCSIIIIILLFLSVFLLCYY